MLTIALVFGPAFPTKIAYASNIKDITYEDGSLTHATSGHDVTVGGASLDSGSSVRGVYSMLTSTNGDLGQEDGTASNTYYVSAYIKFTTLPASGSSRVLMIRNGSTFLARLYVTSAGVIQLRNGAGTQVGSNGPTMATGTIYRMGLRYTMGTGANAVLEAYLATGDDAFGAAFASTSSDAGTAQANRVEAGQQSGGTAAVAYLDSIRIDTAAMPGPDTSATATPTNTPTASDTPTNTPTPSDTPTNTPTASDTPTNTPTPSDTPTNTPTPSDTPTNTPTPSDTPTSTPTDTPTATPFPTPDCPAGDVTLKPGPEGFDAYMRSSNPNQNQGNSVGINVGYESIIDDHKRGALKFDVSSVPIDATITAACLALYGNVTLTTTVQVTINIFSLLRNWVEGEVTWNDWQTGSTWTTAGADSIGNDRTDSIMGVFYVTEQSDWYTTTLDIGTVQDWVDGSISNYGMLLKNTNDTDHYASFTSSDNVEWSRPVLVISYDVPTATPTNTPTPSDTPTATFTPTATITPTITLPPSMTLTPTVTPTGAICSTDEFSFTLTTSANNCVRVMRQVTFGEIYLIATLLMLFALGALYFSWRIITRWMP